MGNTLKCWVGALVIALMAVVPALPAQAQEEVIEHLQVAYEVRDDGALDVEITLDWKFATTDSRGIFYTIVVAEPLNDDPSSVATYAVSNVEVSSPTGASAEFTQERVSQESGHEELLLRVGDPTASVPSPEQTYVISYTIRDALHTYDGVPELHHDVTSKDFPTIEAFEVSISADAGDIVRARCLAGNQECATEISDGQARLSGGPVERGETLTAVAQLPDHHLGAEPSIRQVHQPNLLERAQGAVSEFFASFSHGLRSFVVGTPGGTSPALIALFSALAAPALAFLGSWVGRIRFTRDRYFADVPAGEARPGSRVAKGKRPGELPPRFHPPEAEIELVGHVWNRRFDGSTIAASLTDLATRGGVHVEAQPLSIKKGDASAARSELQRTMHTVAANNAGVPLHKDLAQRLTKQAHREYAEIRKSGGYFLSSNWTLGRVLATVTMGAAPFLIFWALVEQAPGIVIVPLALFLVILAAAFERGGQVGQEALTARGTAIWEQAEGFRKYLATAEAEQLSQEADAGIHRRFLPWAVLFGLTERWNEVCRDMAAMANIPAPDMELGTISEENNRFFKSNVQRQRFNPLASEPGRSTVFDSSDDDSGSSGGSSGFSSSSGGSGSGGSRAGSW